METTKSLQADQAIVACNASACDDKLEGTAGGKYSDDESTDDRVPQRLASLHGGLAEAHGTGPGMGDGFDLQFPCNFPAMTHPAMKHDSSVSMDAQCGARGGAVLRVLVVDDNADAAEALATLLEMMGHEVHVRVDGAEAVTAAGSLRPDVILLDIGLPVLCGYEAARRIREQERGVDIFLVALTGYGRFEDKRRSLEAGFARHLVKPVAPADLEHLMFEVRRRQFRMAGNSL